MVADPTVIPFAFELKDTSLPLVTVLLHQADAAVLADELRQRLGETPNFFDDDPVVIDLAPLRERDEPSRVRRRRRRAAACTACAPSLVTGGSAAADGRSARRRAWPAAPEPMPAPKAAHRSRSR